MRDKWFLQLPVGWYKLTIAERGFLATLWSQGENFTALYDDMDTVFGVGWKVTADRLQKLKCVSMICGRNEVQVSLNLKTEKRRKYMRDYKRSSK